MIRLWGLDSMKKLVIFILLLCLGIGYLTPVSLFAFDDGDLLYIIDNPNVYNTPANDQFGFNMASNGSYLAVSAYNENAGGGVVYIFDIDDGSLIHTIEDPSWDKAYFNDRFGFTMAMTNNYLAVASPYEDRWTATSSGIVYVFNLDDFSLIRTFVNPSYFDNTYAGDQFGWSIAMEGDLLVVGANYDEYNSITNTGTAYVFSIENNILLHAFSDPTPSSYANLYFGTDVAIHGDYILISGHKEFGRWYNYEGKIFVYDITDDYNLIHTIDNPDYYTLEVNDYFGFALDMNDKYIVASAYLEDMGSSTKDVGVVYVFDVDTFSLLHTFVNPSPYGTKVNDYFGWSLSLYDDYLGVGAYQDDPVATTSGSAFIYDLELGSLLYTYIPTVTPYNNSSLGRSILLTNGYIVLGASSSYDTTGTYSASGVVYVYQNETIIIENEVTFDSNGGSLIAPINVIDNTILTPPADPTLDGYMFERWYVDEDLTVAFDFSDPITDDITLYARWVEGSSGGVLGGITNNFAFMLIAMILYFALLFLRIITGIRIWNFFGIGILIYFLIQYIDVIPMVIVLVGFILYQLYDTFFGGK